MVRTVSRYTLSCREYKLNIADCDLFDYLIPAFDEEIVFHSELAGFRSLGNRPVGGLLLLQSV
jgi:hypothetical protein